MLKAQTQDNTKKFHFNQYGVGNLGEKPSGSPHYDHDTHEAMFTWHIPDENKKKEMRKDAHERVKNGTTKGHLAAETTYKVLDDFKERLQEAEGNDELENQVLSEMYDWLMVLHAQHEGHGLHKDNEFRQAYTDAHTFHSQRMATKGV